MVKSISLKDKDKKETIGIRFYLCGIGLILIAVSFIFKNKPNAKYLTGFGLVILTISFMVKKEYKSFFV